MNENKIKTYHTNLLKPYWIPISIICIVIRTFLLALAAGSIVEPLNKSNSVFFHKLGIAYDRVDSWNFLVNINLKPIKTKIEKLHDIEKKLCTIEEFNSTEIGIQNEIFDLENQYSNLFTTTETTRVKRGVINGIGKGLNWLFGTMDSDDQEEYSKNIENLSSNQVNIQNLMDHQISLVKTSTEAIDRTSLTFQRNNQRLEKIIETMETDMNRVNVTLVAEMFYNLYEIFEAQLNHIRNQINTLQTAIFLAKRDILHPAVIIPKTLLDSMKLVSLPAQRKFPLPSTSAMVDRYADLSSIHTKILGNHLPFDMSIPITKDTEYNIYSLLPLPTPHPTRNEFYFFISLKYKFLIINPTCTEYSLFSKKMPSSHSRYIHLPAKQC